MEDKKERVVRGGAALSTGTYAFDTRGAETQANEEIRSVIFTGLFEHPLVGSIPLFH